MHLNDFCEKYNWSTTHVRTMMSRPDLKGFLVGRVPIRLRYPEQLHANLMYLKNRRKVKHIKMPKYRAWSLTALECYERGCVCNNCSTALLLEANNCKMREVVKSLISNNIPLPKDFETPQII